MSNLEHPRRPGLVLLIFGIYTILGGLSFLYLTAHFLYHFSLSTQPVPLFDSDRRFQTVTTLLNGAANITGGIFLFRLHRYAYPCFLIAAFAALVKLIYNFTNGDWVHGLPISGIFAVSVVWAIYLGIIFYTRSLIKRRILR